MSLLPHWARVPKVREGKVVATNNGWVWKREGRKDELLAKIRGLDARLRELKAEAHESVKAIKPKSGRPAGTTKAVLEARAKEQAEHAEVDAIEAEKVEEAEAKPEPKPKPKRKPRAKKVAPKSEG